MKAVMDVMLMNQRAKLFQRAGEDISRITVFSVAIRDATCVPSLLFDVICFNLGSKLVILFNYDSFCNVYMTTEI